jgi:hypothetical protein
MAKVFGGEYAHYQDFQQKNPELKVRQLILKYAE